MDVTQFENKLFAYLEKQSLVLTPLNVGFALDIDVVLAERLLAELYAADKLELVRGEGASATYREMGCATYETSPTENAVSGPISPKAINQMALNFRFPGLGSLVVLNPWGCLPIFAAFVVSGFMLYKFPGWTKAYALAPFLGAWLWSIIVGIGGYYLDDRSGGDTYLFSKKSSFFGKKRKPSKK